MICVAAIAAGFGPGAAKLVAVGNNAAIVSSVNGISDWALRSGHSYYTGVASNGSMFVAVTSLTANLSTSPDGITWTNRTLTANNSLRAVAWSPELGLWVACGTSYVYTSNDGVTWTQRDISAVFSGTMLSITWSSALGKFCVMGSNKCAVSSDGITWSAGSYSGSGASIAWSPALGLFVAGGLGTAGIRSSTNGTAWTARYSTSTVTIVGIAWSPELNLFAAVSNAPSGAPLIITSPDGINWTSRTQPFVAGPYYAITWSSALGLFVAARSTGQIVTSSDGITWDIRSTPTGEDLLGVCAAA